MDSIEGHTPRNEYWSEAIGEALSTLNKYSLFTSDEIDELGKALATAAECESAAFGWDVASSNLHASHQREADNLRKDLLREKAKVVCGSCGGEGRLRYNSGPWAVNTECSKCHGEGRHDP